MIEVESEIIHTAIEENSVGTAEKLLEYGVDINCKNADDKTPFFLVVHLMTDGEFTAGNKYICGDDKKFYKYLNILNLLLKYRANINIACPIENHIQTRNPTRYTPLQVACEKGSEKLAQLLLEHGANPNIFEKGSYSPLQLAVLLKSEINIESLLQYNADINAKSEHGTTALYLATEICFVKGVEILLKYNPDLQNDINKRCIYLAIGNGNKASGDIFEALLEYGYTLNMGRINTTKTILKAISSDCVKIVEYLIRNGVDLKNCHNGRLLHYAVKKNAKTVVSLLLNYASTKGREFLNCLVNSNHINGETPIFYSKDKNITEILIKFGAKIDIKNWRGDTPLHKAAINNNSKIVNTLLKFGANVTLRNGNDSLPVHVCLNDDLQKPEIITMLLLNDFDTNLNPRYEDNIMKLYSFSRSCRLTTVSDIIQEYLIKKYAVDQDLYKTVSAYMTVILKYHPNNKFLLRKCKSEIKRLKYNKVDGNVSYYDILIASKSQLITYTRNKNIQKVINARPFIIKFSQYGKIIASKFKRASDRKNLLNEYSRHINLISDTFSKLPYECKEIIINYLDNDDLKIILPDSVISSIYKIRV